ncbi:sensor histidine kinase [Pseudoalteromonas fenneropenaei]|uniref:histidine kinase n=1 Tax=Pseudoalteromonas fenneropenaei TaxID=1737459 RepID=A0ABV7CI39_9GAMM
MRFSLYTWLALTFTALFIAITTTFVWWTDNLATVTRAQAEQQLHLHLAAHLVQDNPLLAEGVYDQSGLENLFHTLMLLGPAFEFYFISPHGEVLAFSAKLGEVKRQQIDPTPLVLLQQTKAQQDSVKLPVYGDDPRQLTGTKIFSAAPVFRHQQLQGYLYIIIGSAKFDSIFAQLSGHSLLLQGGIGIALLLVFLFAAMLVMFLVITRPIRQLSLFIRQSEQVQFDLTRVPMLTWPHSHSEIAMLGNSVNTMLTTINKQFRTLTEQDSQRRTLLSHLSHDLRTPLASLQGYLELIDSKLRQCSHDNIPTEGLALWCRNALRQCDKLKLLVGQIFELAQLEAGQAKVNRERFPLAELVQDICAKFAPLAQQQGIQLIAPTQKQNVSVLTDMAKLERILSNLLDNALRHTPKQGKIEITVTATHTHTKLCVIDSGIGIAPADLPHVFKTSYQASNSNAQSGINAGLGLAICAELCRLLAIELSVNSELGTGTQFSLLLKNTDDCDNQL